jgi:hypothetical protein
MAVIASPLVIYFQNSLVWQSADEPTVVRSCKLFLLWLNQSIDICCLFFFNLSDVAKDRLA